MAGALTFSLKDIYPNLGYESTQESTSPEPAEQAKIGTSEPGTGNKATPLGKNIGMWLLILLGLVVVFHIKL